MHCGLTLSFGIWETVELLDGWQFWNSPQESRRQDLIVHCDLLPVGDIGQCQNLRKRCNLMFIELDVCHAVRFVSFLSFLKILKILKYVPLKESTIEAPPDPPGIPTCPFTNEPFGRHEWFSSSAAYNSSCSPFATSPVAKSPQPFAPQSSGNIANGLCELEQRMAKIKWFNWDPCLDYRLGLVENALTTENCLIICALWL